MISDSLMRAEIALESRQWGVLAGELTTVLRATPSLAIAQKVISLMHTAAAWHEFVKHRIYFLRSFTVEPVVPFLRARAALHSLACDVRVGAFNAYPQELLTDNSELYAFEPACVILAIRTPDVLPLVWSRFEESTTNDISTEIADALVRIKQWITAFRRRSDATLIIHDLETPPFPQAGILDSQRTSNQTSAIQRFNNGLAELLLEFRAV